MLPSRIMISKLDVEELPRFYDINFEEGWRNESATEEKITEIRNRWRYQKRS